MENIIIDTDPWVDDALAIMYLLKAWIYIKWITTVFWNSNLDNTTNNALKILSIMKKEVDVYSWESIPLKVQPTFAKSHWDWWFWGYNIDFTITKNKTNAVDFYINLLQNSNNNVIICLGPTTNIAKVALLRPELIKNISKLIILWWVLNEKWNISPFAEFNVYNDPDALEIVLSLDIEKYLIPINICRKVFFTLNDFNKINNNNLSLTIKEITNQYIKYYTTNKEYWDFQWWVMYDLLATVFYTNPEIFSFKESFIEVSLLWENIWETIENINSKNKNCNVIIWVNFEKLKDLFFNTMNYE